MSAVSTGAAVSETPAPWELLLANANKAMSEGREVRVDPATIRPMPNQPRKYFSEEGIARLADSMVGVGQIVPGIIRAVEPENGTAYELLDGERRWRAATRASISYRATLVTVDDASVPFIIAAVANFNREGHTPLEVCDSIGEMVKLGIPMEEIARILGLSLHWTYQMYGLRNLHPKVREMLDPNLPKSQVLPVSAAVQISKAVPSLQLDLATRVLSRTLSLRSLRNEVIKVSNDAGEHLRMRRREPRKLWDSIDALSGVLRRTSVDLEALLREEAVAAALKARDPEELLLIKNRLDMTYEAIHKSQGHIQAL
jgi:ParB/RepB/Spo0J family partition protein